MFTQAQLQYLRDEMRQKLPEKRYLHTLAVEKEAAALAKIYLPDRESEVRAAALLHDMTKYLRDNEQIFLAGRLGIPITEDDIRCPHILHGKTAAEVIRIDFPAFVTLNIQSAIRLHTTGGERMSVFDMILFVADFTEPTREYEACQKLRRSMWREIRKDPSVRTLRHAVVQEMEFTIAYLKREKLPIVSATVHALHAQKEIYESECEQTDV